ncbi:hypothetical protein CKAH01_15049 [Colletotrichum kahawae]|uniref:Uncharacterized protein n=1 Tax=Colletotrichum kahawae TaxID=34407 RepID=A0AAD9YL84_COLKA|nr:hypothetical protein CKAH01_15049 [Colletotrichum kahawae]
MLNIDDIMRDNRDDDEGYGSSRDTSAQDFPERHHDDALNKDMLNRRLQHFQLSDTDSNHATVIIGDRFSRLMAGYFEECLDDSGEFELTEYILLQPGATIDIQVAVPDLNRAASFASRTGKTLSRMEREEIPREIAQGKIHGWNGLAGEETQSSSDTLAHFIAWSGVRSPLLHTFRGRKPNTNNKRSRDELEEDSRERKRACPL